MPRAAKGPRLWWRKPRPAKAGRSAERGVWIIRDDRHQHSTGCGQADREGAERALQEWIAQKHSVPRKQRRIDAIPIADVLNLYLQDKVPGLATALKATGRIERLLDWWGSMMLDEVTGAACRQFASSRGPGAARRELQDLQAAISYHHREGLHRELVQVTLPPAGLARQRWLTRDEVAHLLRICLHHKEKQNGVGTSKRPIRHLARLILFGAYTGSRTGDCLSASFRVHGKGGFVDTASGLYFRLPSGKRATNKRQPTVPLAGRLRAHLERWERMGSAYVVGRFGMAQVGSVKTAWRRLIELAGPEFADVVPYTLRHTAITWMLQRGVEVWECAGYVGTSPAMIERVYGHHSPTHLANAAKAIGGRQ